MDREMDERNYMLLRYIAGGYTKKACYLIAEYRIDIWQVMDWMKNTALPEELKECLPEDVTLTEYLYRQMLESDVSYEEYYEIFLHYPCGEYAQILIPYARREDRRTDAVAMSDLIKPVVQKRMTSMNHKELYSGQLELNPGMTLISYYADRLGDLSYVRDYQEIRKCVNEAVKEYRYEQDVLRRYYQEWLPGFWTNLLRCTNILGRYDRTIELSRTIDIKITDPDYYFFVAEAYYAQKDIDKALRYARRSAALKDGQKNLILLAQIYMSKQQYREAEKLLVQSVGMMSQVIRESYTDSSRGQYSEQINIRKLYEKEYREKFETPYTLLFFCYVCEGDYVKAKSFYEDIKEELGNADIVLISAAMLSVNEKVKNHLNQVEETKGSLRRQLEKARSDNREKSRLLRQWTLLMVECQVSDEVTDISEEYWNDNIKQKMEAAIDKISSIMKQSDYRRYAEKEKNTRRLFPKMPEDAVKFFTSADQMYETFEHNPIIDFAPIMVEYCKVIEYMLWYYLDRTGEYSYETAMNENRMKTIGTATWAIEKAGPGRPLYPYLDELNKINRMRCESAHNETSREPYVKYVREYIIESGIISTLCS